MLALCSYKELEGDVFIELGVVVYDIIPALRGGRAERLGVQGQLVHIIRLYKKEGRKAESGGR